MINIGDLKESITGSKNEGIFDLPNGSGENSFLERIEGKGTPNHINEYTPSF